MAYAVGKLIEAADYNMLAFGSPDGIINSSVPNVNSLLGVGFRNIGYDTSLALLSYVPVGQVVTASNWNSLITYINFIANHQGTQVDTMVTPSEGDTITAVQSIINNVHRIFANASNSNQNSYDTLNIFNYQNLSSNITSWQNYIQIQTTMSFTSGETARLFFNRGGSIQLSPYYNSPTSTTLGTKATYVNNMIRSLGLQVGNLYMTGALTSSRVLFGVQPFNGITQTLGSAPGITTNPSRSTVYSANGYYSMRPTDQIIHKQLYSPSADDIANIPEYCNSYIETTARTSGNQGPNNDTGNTIIFTTRFNQLVSSGANANIAFSGFPISAGINLSLGLPPANYFSFDTPTPTVSVNITSR